MKSLFIVLTIVISNSFVFAHDVAIAVFHISESNESIQIDIAFDIEDFCESIGIKAEEVNLEKMQNYLNDNTSFQFNTLVSSLEVLEIKIVRDHIKVRGVFEKVVESVKTIKIRNNCLINVSGHSNIIKVDLNDKSKDYRMHKERTEINLAY